ncbi:MAG: cytochrome c3 family protein [Syntrophobacter sp.]
MEKGRLLHLLAGIFLLCASILIIRFDAGGVMQPDSATQPSRADMITIDTLAPFGKLELPPVAFPHDKHTEALLKENKDCKTCHSV